MPQEVLGKRKRGSGHPYLSGNFAPIQQTWPLTPCSYEGQIPNELLGGQYVRNGGNPVSNEDLGRDAHWFDGDGMLSGVSFHRNRDSPNEVQPEFVNQYVLTDLYLSAASTKALRKPITPSISTLVNPLSSLLKICLAVFRTILLAFLSRLPGSSQTIKKISVANTSIFFHDGRALAGCESGPPMRIALPSLETVGWFNGANAENEPRIKSMIPSAADTLGGDSIISFMKEWTTAHPKVDPITNEMILFHSYFLPPYVNYSVIPATRDRAVEEKAATRATKRLINAPVSGVSGAKMMHDFGVSHNHTVIMDLPLTLDPLQLARNRPPIMYDATKPSRFGVFARHDPSNVSWFETNPCCIFHTANTWDVTDSSGQITSVDMLTCRMTSATFVFSAGNIAAPAPTVNAVEDVRNAMPEELERAVSNASRLSKTDSYDKAPILESTVEVPNDGADFSDFQNSRFVEADHCGLYYYSFSMEKTGGKPRIAHQFSLSRVPFEFPSVSPKVEMSNAQFIYGCTTTNSSFNAALGRSAKIDALVKIDAKTLIQRGKASPPNPVVGCVDTRSAQDVVSGIDLLADETDPIQIFRAPPDVYLQEPRFVPRKDAKSEDDGYLLTYAFDESQLDEDGEAPESAKSELWIIDAMNMSRVLAKVSLPQRVPYGMHGGWFSEKMVNGQRDITGVRNMSQIKSRKGIIRSAGRHFINTVLWSIGG